MVAIARRNLSAFTSAVEVRERTLEGWEPGSTETFDALIAATSFWWVDRAVRYAKTAAALRPGGCAAALWDAPARQPGRNRAPSRRSRRPTGGTRLTWWACPRRRTSSRLPPLPASWRPASSTERPVRHYPWSETYDTERYLKLLRTYSGHIVLSEKHHVAVLQTIRRRAA